MGMLKNSRWLILALVITGCTRFCGTSHSDMNPEQVVEAYLNVALNMTSVAERGELMEYTTGNLKNAISQASDETLKAAYIDRKYKIENYSVVERRDRTPRETEVTFRLTYKDLGTAEPKPVNEAPKVTTENTVSVVRENKLWLIKDVMGNKTSIDFPVAPESQISAKPGPGIDKPEDVHPDANVTP